MDNNQKCNMLGHNAQQKSIGAYAAILYVVGLNIALFIALPKNEWLQDLCNMILTPLVMFFGSYPKAYIAVFVVEIVGILMLQNIAVSEKAKAEFFNGH